LEGIPSRFPSFHDFAFVGTQKSQPTIFRRWNKSDEESSCADLLIFYILMGLDSLWKDTFSGHNSKICHHFCPARMPRKSVETLLSALELICHVISGWVVVWQAPWSVVPLRKVAPVRELSLLIPPGGPSESEAPPKSSNFLKRKVVQAHRSRKLQADRTSFTSRGLTRIIRCLPGTSATGPVGYPPAGAPPDKNASTSPNPVEKIWWYFSRWVCQRDSSFWSEIIHLRSRLTGSKPDLCTRVVSRFFFRGQRDIISEHQVVSNLFSRQKWFTFCKLCAQPWRNSKRIYFLDFFL